MDSNFIFEAGVLAQTPRSGIAHFGTGKQSIAEHSFRVMCIGHILASHYKKVNMTKILLMCLYHDFHESRTGDLNALHKKYCHADERSARKDIFDQMSFGSEIMSVLNERELLKTVESKIAKDADILEWIAFLIEQKWNGNKKSDEWIVLAMPKLQTKIAKMVAKQLLVTHPDEWWQKILCIPVI